MWVPSGARSWLAVRQEPSDLRSFTAHWESGLDVKALKDLGEVSGT